MSRKSESGLTLSTRGEADGCPDRIDAPRAIPDRCGDDVTKDEILEAIRDSAAKNGGTPVGRGRLERLTGVTEYAVSKYWPTYNLALAEAGFRPNTLQGRTDDTTVLDRFIGLTRDLGHVPTASELRIARTHDSSFPSNGVFARFGSKAHRVESALHRCRGRGNLDDVVAILEASRTPGNERVDSISRQVSPLASFVYLAQGHKGEYKIGRTNLVDRRLAELGTKSAVELTLIHEIKTDDPVGVEGYWHQRFAEKQMRGEWFRLTATDVSAFRRWRRIW